MFCIVTDSVLPSVAQANNCLLSPEEGVFLRKTHPIHPASNTCFDLSQRELLELELAGQKNDSSLVPAWVMPLPFTPTMCLSNVALYNTRTTLPFLLFLYCQLDGFGQKLKIPRSQSGSIAQICRTDTATSNTAAPVSQSKVKASSWP